MSSQATKKRKILVIEDDDNIQALLHTLLTRRNFDVERADSGLMGLGALSRSVPDLILLDIAMPDMDGLTFLERKQRFPEIKNVPLIVLSARDRTSDIAAAIDRGADTYMTKPFDNSRLLACIDRLLPAEPVVHSRRKGVVW